MSRVLLLNMAESTVRNECEKFDIGISALKSLSSNGVRLVCMSVDGAESARKRFKAKLIKGDVIRTKHRPTRPLW